MSNKITVRRGTAAPTDQVLSSGEFGYDTTNKKLYIGNGIGEDPTLINAADLSFQIDINRYGFLNQTETTLSFDNASIFTLGDAGAGWSYYRAGLKYTISGNKSVDLLTVDNPLVNGRIYFISIDSTDGTLSASVSPWTLNDTKLPVAYIIWNSTLTPKYLLADERHSCLIDRRTHYHEHFTEGTKGISIGAISGYTVNTDTNAAKAFGIAASKILDEDIIHNLSALAEPDGSTAAYTILYRTGASSWAWKTSNMPFAYNIGNTNDWIQWDNGGTMTDATGGAGALTRWINTYLIMTNFGGAARYIIVPGQHIYSDLLSAQNEALSSFVWTGFPIQECVIAYKLTWTTYTSTSQGKCMLAQNPVLLSLGSITSLSNGANIDHNTLAGLQGGAANDYYHLTAAQLATALAPVADIVDATPTVGGKVNTTTQSFGGAKTFVDTTDATNTATGALIVAGGLGVAKSIHATDVWGANWNDYAEFRQGIDDEFLIAGICVCENGLDQLEKSKRRLQPGAFIISDTFGFSIGRTDIARTPIAVSGRVLAHTYRNRNKFKVGQPVCAAPNGTIDRMTRLEAILFPDRMIGTVSCVPTYQNWGEKNVAINNRIWIYVK